MIQQSIPAVSTTFLTALASTYSVTAIAAYGVAGKLETILFYPAMALNMVLATIIGQCIGGGAVWPSQGLSEVCVGGTAVVCL